MRLGVGQRQRPRGRGDDPDQALADPQPRPVHRLGPQPLGGEQLEHLAGAHDVGRADLGDHVGGDDADDAVEPLLRGARPGHDVAQTAQQRRARSPTRGDPDRALRQPESPACRWVPPGCRSFPGPGPRGAALRHVRMRVSPSARGEQRPAPGSTSSSRISAVLCSRVTKPTLCPAISEPASTSPSITARRSAPAQKCSISSCASFCDSSPRANRSMTARCIAANRSVAGLASARTGITGKRGSSWTEGTASRAAARMKACLKFADGRSIRGRRQSGCRAAPRPRPSRDRTASPRRGRSRRRRRPAPR